MTVGHDAMTPGTRIGPYHLIRELGRGGMGEVFLARDSRLDRQVAIKAIPAHMAADADRLARFQREAKMLASLNHPSIGAIYGLEESEGRQYLILEFIEGETLAQRLTQGPIPIDEALNIAKQMAEALEAAHDKGIVHRDLKPGNVMVTDAGVAKVLDFGLARTAEGAPTSSNYSASLADSPTITSPAARAQPVHSPTIPGVIMGSAGYMSPEQARGKPVDKRSDIFSFGCVLYEMLSGAQPFAGETVADSLGAILHREPDWSLLPPATPPVVRQLLKRCLAKDKHHRLRDMGDARMEIEQAIADPRGVASGIHAAMPEPPRAWWGSPVVLLSVALLAAAAAVAALALRPTPVAARQAERTVVRAELTLPKGLVLLEGDRAIAVSPDGTKVVVAAFQPGSAAPPSLYLRDLSRLDFRPLPGTENATYPFWSPDGASIAFLVPGKLKRIDLADNIVRNICDAPVGRGGSWGTKGTIVFAPSAGGELLIVSASGGTATPITAAPAPGESHRMPQFLPDGERFIYFAQNIEKEGIYTFDPVAKKSRLILEAPSEGFFVEPGFLVFARDENLMAQAFDPARLELTGTATPIAADLTFSLPRGFTSAGISPAGTLVYQPVTRLPRSKLAWMDLKGERTPIAVEPLAMSSGTLSADARRAAVQVTGDRGESTLAVLDLERGITTMIADPKAKFLFGTFLSGDGQRVFTSIVNGGKQNLASYPASGGAPTILMEGDGSEYFASSTTPDGRTLLFVKTPLLDKAGDIMTLELGVPQSAKVFLQTPEPEWNALLSPAGDAVLCVVGREEGVNGLLKVVAFPTPGVPVQVAPTPAVWTFDWLGPHEVFWVDMARRVWSAEITVKGAQIDVGSPKPLFEGRPLDKQVRIFDFDIAKQRFLIAFEDEPREDPRLVIVSDWRPAPAPATPRE
jgi:Tol biopolymer transport system component